MGRRGHRSGSSSSGASGGTSGGYSNVYSSMYDAGIRNEGDAYAWLLSNGASSTEARELTDYFLEWMEGQAGDAGGDEQADSNITYGPGYSTEVSTGTIKGSEWDAIKHNLLVNLRSGNFESVERYMDLIADGLSEAQYRELAEIMRPYGYNM